MSYQGTESEPLPESGVVELADPHCAFFGWQNVAPIPDSRSILNDAARGYRANLASQSKVAREPDAEPAVEILKACERKD